MSTHESYVSLETAKMLKQAGFDWGSRDYYYDCSGEGEFRFYNMQSNHIIDWNHWPCRERNISAPTIEVAQRWLREEKLYNVLVNTGGYKNYEYFIDYHGVKEGPNYPFHEYNHNLICNTYEEALEAGIKKVLEIILEKGE